MKSQRAYTLVEILISFVIGSLLILMVGALSGIGNSSFNKVRQKADIFNDISYAYKFMQNRVREAAALTLDTPTDTAWQGPRLIVDRGAAGGVNAFGVFRAGGRDEFVYLVDSNDVNTRRVLFAVPLGGTNNLQFNFSLSGDSATLTAQLTGTRAAVPFDVSTVIVRRTR